MLLYDVPSNLVIHNSQHYSARPGSAGYTGSIYIDQKGCVSTLPSSLGDKFMELLCIMKYYIIINNA